MAYTTINKSSLNFNTKLYTGNGGTNNITGVGFKPDLVWTKQRTDAADHRLYDIVRGVYKQIASNTSAAEETSNTTLTAFGSDGFSLGSNADANQNAKNFASWNWKAGTAVSGNTTGSGTSKSYSGSVNTTSGFSIIKYTGNGSSGHTIPHRLGVTPKMIIVKSTSNAYEWTVYHASLGATKWIELQSTAAANTGSLAWNNTTPTSSVFTVGNNNRTNGSATYVAYCFAEKQGYSKFGSYTGNGNADGTFVYTGFKPTWVMAKRSNSASSGNWNIRDTKRSPINLASQVLQADSTAVEGNASGTLIDIYSNGFKPRNGGSGVNANNSPYIYMAFGQSIVGTNNIPATAR